MLHELKKHWLVYKIYFKQAFIRRAQYRFSFVMGILNTLGWSLLRLVYYFVAFEHITTVRDWTVESSLVLAGTFMIVNSVFKFLFEGNFYVFVESLYQGEFDHILTKPISGQFVVTARHSVARSLIRALVGVAILIYALRLGEFALGASNYLAYFIMILVGITLAYSFYFAIVCLAFWLGNVKNLNFLGQLFVSNTYMPFDIFPSPILEIITLVIPLIFIVTIPAKVLLYLDITALLAGIFVAVIAFLAARKVWLEGLKRYTSVSS